jgi:2,4-dienoyl-CoA reductase-like NADH-dependent reductase (Old Yellow Enzyme family)
LPHPELFTPIQLGGITLPNRIVVSPMCQYSAADGCMSDWHLMHLGSLACSGAGLLMVEATGVTREGRISHGCTGLYSDDNEAAMARVLQSVRRISKHPVGIQIGHAGRKASVHPPFVNGGAPLGESESPWRTLAPSAIPFGEGWHVPRELDLKDIKTLVENFVAATLRAKRVGYDALELHGAHGYLIHQFLSPLSNQRKDEYGKNRSKFPLEVAHAVREAWPKERALGARISANDWVEGGLGPDDAVAFARELKKAGFDYVCVSSGAIAPKARIPVAPGYQAGFSETIKNAVPVAVRAVGMIFDADQAQEIVASGKADMVAMARAFLDDPRWVWHAAERFGVRLDYPPQYARSRGDVWPGAQLARPGSKVA